MAVASMEAGAALAVNREKYISCGTSSESRILAVHMHTTARILTFSLAFFWSAPYTLVMIEALTFDGLLTRTDAGGDGVSAIELPPAKTPKGRGGLVLYLDYDGVLHHENCLWHPRRGAYLSAPARYTLFQHSELLAQLLAPYPALAIVLSTTWICRYGVSASTKRLPEVLQNRVIGGTLRSRYMRESEFKYLLRGEQVFADVQRRQPRDWLALDDNCEGWPQAHLHHWVQTDPYEGISDPEVLNTFQQKLEAMCKPQKARKTK